MKLRLAMAGSLLATGTLVLTGCGSASDNATGSGNTGQLNPADVTIIDVRTPGEFANGHLQNAVNINLQSADFAEQVSQLSRSGTYVVYCRSGNRSAEAVSQMKDMGFTQVTDAGGMSEASGTTGVQIVQ